MTPEEKFNNKVWEILQKIKEEILFNNDKEIKWKESRAIPDRKPFNFDKGEKATLDYLKKINTIKMRESFSVLCKLPEIGDPNYSQDEFIALLHNGGIIDNCLYLKILQPKFDEIYNKYKKLAKTNSVPKTPKNKDNWHQTGWGQVLVGLIVLIVGTIILKLLGII
ncbi:MAG: hypothetical protein WC303_01005 [Candidatus Paceibacterota bacterium]|jgi:hypothetical protein